MQTGGSINPAFKLVVSFSLSNGDPKYFFTQGNNEFVVCNEKGDLIGKKKEAFDTPKKLVDFYRPTASGKGNSIFPMLSIFNNLNFKTIAGISFRELVLLIDYLIRNALRAARLKLGQAHGIPSDEWSTIPSGAPRASAAPRAAGGRGRPVPRFRDARDLHRRSVSTSYKHACTSADDGESLAERARTLVELGR